MRSALFLTFIVLLFLIILPERLKAQEMLSSIESLIPNIGAMLGVLATLIAAYVAYVVHTVDKDAKDFRKNFKLELLNDKTIETIKERGAFLSGRNSKEIEQCIISILANQDSDLQNAIERLGGFVTQNQLEDVNSQIRSIEIDLSGINEITEPSDEKTKTLLDSLKGVYLKSYFK